MGYPVYVVPNKSRVTIIRKDDQEISTRLPTK